MAARVSERRYLLRVSQASANQSSIDAGPPASPNLPPDPQETPGAKRVGKNTLEILLFRGLSTPIALLLVVIQSRFLAPEGRGAFVLVVLSVTLFSRLLGQLGVAVTNHMREDHFDEPAEVKPLVHRALLLGLALGLVGGSLVALWGYLTPAIGLTTAALAGAALVPNVIWQTKSGILLGQSRIRLWNYVQMASPLLTLIGMLILVVGLDGGVRAAVFAWALAHFATASLALLLARDLWSPLRATSIVDVRSRVLVRLALAMGAMQVVALFSYRVELYILERLEDLAAVGIYSIAMQAAESLWLIAAALATAVTAPVVHAREDEAVALIKKTALRSLLFTGLAALVVGALAPLVIPHVFGEDFSDAATPLLLLLPGVLLYAPVTVLVVYLSVRQSRPHLSLLVALTAMVVTLACAVPLISLWGAAGAALASTAGYAAGAALAVAFFIRLRPSADALSLP